MVFKPEICSGRNGVCIKKTYSIVLPDGVSFLAFCPMAGLALPFPIDEKEAKILSKRTLRRAF